MNRRQLRSVRLDVLDWLDRNADLIAAAAIALLFIVGGILAGSTDDNTGQIVTTPSPVVTAVPGSPTHGNARVEPGTAGTEEP